MPDPSGYAPEDAADYGLATQSRIELPFPPPELRRLVCHEDELFALPHAGTLVFPYIAPALYRSVFDFGCGCGRIARQLLAQEPRPRQYVGIDINKGMISWCQDNLSPVDPAFQFHHHDVWNLSLGPDNTRQATAPFPARSGEFSLVIAHSVFTHVYKEQTEYYLSEIARLLTEDGIARTTWFLFDRATFPMLFDFQVSLFINETDPSNAVIYDWCWLLDLFSRNHLRVIRTVPPTVKGNQWELYLSKITDDGQHDFPDDAATRSMMCGSGPGSIETVPQSSQPIDAQAPRQLLRYSSSLSAGEFEARCREIPWWYHSYYFDNGFRVRGDYDIGADVANYGFPESMEGMRVLDIGTGAGWFGFVL